MLPPGECVWTGQILPTLFGLVIIDDANVQDAEDARRDEEERAHRSDQMRRNRAAVRRISSLIIC